MLVLENDSELAFIGSLRSVLHWLGASARSRCFRALQRRSTRLRKTTLSREAFQFDPSQVVNEFGRKIEKTTFTAALQLQKSVGAKIRELGGDQVRVVLYPFFGTDGGTVLDSFRDADVYVVMDDHPMFPEIPRKFPIVVQDKVSLTWQDEPHVVKGSSVAQQVLGSLHSAEPHLQILSTELLQEPAPRGQKIHTLIHFNTGPGTRDKIFLHLNVSLDGETFQGSWWFKSLSETISNRGKLGLVVRASQNQLTNLDLEEDFEALAQLRGAIAYGTQAELGSLILPDRARKLGTGAKHFSYGENTAEIWDISPKKNRMSDGSIAPKKIDMPSTFISRPVPVRDRCGVIAAGLYRLLTRGGKTR